MEFVLQVYRGDCSRPTLTVSKVVRDTAWPDYEIKFTGTTIWRTLLPWDAVKDLDPRFEISGWWYVRSLSSRRTEELTLSFTLRHTPTTHVYFSPVGEGLWEIAARAWHDPAVHSASKEYLPEIREALARVPPGGWREFAAFAGPELESLTAWDNKIVLVGDSSHALSGAFGSGAGFAMEDGWILAQSLAYAKNELRRALPLFEAIRLPYYSRMYAHLASDAARRASKLREIGNPSFDEQVANKTIVDGGGDMSWIYQNNIGTVWNQSVEALNGAP
ncbi:hypothetical protein MPH_05778 [Macrophomina phaseolina MS6]|uniref:Monooxygenase FAD-binding protein n=1 Tax=Macrophomina phaseolina (strain MS6) TaxID=1126212 RepID=K2RQE0_MACPH|nr:hypothetical protein MPH_05778 [Macrophomina phaseolina MS6]